MPDEFAVVKIVPDVGRGKFVVSDRFSVNPYAPENVIVFAAALAIPVPP